MTTEPTATNDAPTRYATALDTHYTIKDLRGALKLYQSVIACHPESSEAGYSRTQIQNIANTVVPKSEAFDTTVAMVIAHLDQGEQQQLPLVAPEAQTPGSSDDADTPSATPEP